MSPDSCKHYTGDHHNTHCAAGICYRDVTSEPDRQFGVAFRKPCIQWDKFKAAHPMSPGQLAEWGKRGRCIKFELPTAEELAAYDKKNRLRIKNFIIARQAIVSELQRRYEAGENGTQMHTSRRQHKTYISGSGSIQCPVCAGTLNYGCSEYNGHINAACSNLNCVRWME